MDNAKVTLPPLRQDLKLVTNLLGVGGSPAWLLHDRPRNRFFRLGWLESELLRRWKTSQDSSHLTQLINQETTLKITEDQVKKFIYFLTINQLIQPKSAEELVRFKSESQQKSGWIRWLLHHYLFFSIPLIRPDRLLETFLKRFSWILSSGFFNLTLFFGIVGLYLVSRRWDDFLTTFSHLFSFEGILIFFLAISLSKMVHEFGHALMAKKQGCKVPTMGVAFLVMWPVLYTDTSDTWRLTSKNQRLKVVMAGVVAELMLAGMATLMWNFSEDGPLKSALLAVATVTWVATLLINGNPLMRFDGYFMLSDWLEIENLQERSFAMGRWKIRRLFLGLNHPPPEQFSKRKTLFLIGFAWTTWIYRFFLFLGIALLVYHFFFKVLGVFLMLVEIYWFIVGPIVRELKTWFKSSGRLNRGSVSTLVLILLILSAVVVIPWQGQIILPAVLRSEGFIQIFPPSMAQLSKVYIKVGMHVSKGDRLFDLISPDLQQQLRLNQLDRKRYLHESQRPGVDQTVREERSIALQNLAASQTEYKGLKAIQSQLQITAPFSGIITHLAEGMVPGTWVAREQSLAHLRQPGTEIMRAYVDEIDRKHIWVGQQGKFFPNDQNLPMVQVKVVSIDPSAISSLEWPYLASIYDGPLAVRRESDGRLVSDQSLYRIYLHVQMNTLNPEHIVLGEVSLPGKKESIGKKIGLGVWAVLVRESGF